MLSLQIPFNQASCVVELKVAYGLLPQVGGDVYIDVSRTRDWLQSHIRPLRWQAVRGLLRMPLALLRKNRSAFGSAEH